MLTRVRELARRMVQTKNLEGAPVSQQALDMIRLKFGRYNVGITDYFAYRLYRTFREQPESIKNYLGWRLENAVNLALNDRKGVNPAWDKLAFETIMRSKGLPTPPAKACFRVGDAWIPGVTALTNDQALKEFLCDPASYPFYLKAAFSQQGMDSHVCLEYLPGKDAVRTSNIEILPIDSLIAQMTRPDDAYFRKKCGWIFQDILVPHPDIRRATGSSSISGARVVLCQEESAPRIAAAIWKIAAGKNHNDNFSGGKTGNWVARIDIATGKAVEPLAAFWPEAALPAWKNHPIAKLDGFTLPDWNNALKAIKSASHLFPLMRIQHWDVAFTGQGPVLLEVNDLGAIGFLQMHGKGLIDGGLRQTLKQMARNPIYTHTQPHRRWIAKL